MTWSLLDIVEALGCAVYGPVGDDGELAAIVVGDDGGAGAGVAIDTRLVEAGSIFVALQGTRSHGIEHAAEAFRRGAVAVVAGTDLEVDDERWEQLLGAAAELGPVLVASDCDGVTALGRLARAWRRRSNWRVVGITGSSGKTGTKDLLAALLRRAGRRVVASHANWNNEIGVPLTLLAGSSGCDVVICEMGMRGAGQIAWLCDVADPDVGIVTTAGTAHLELLGSREAIIAAKAELLTGTWAGGVGVFPGREPALVEAAERVPDRLLPFGVGEDEADDAAVVVTELRRTADGIAGTIDLMGEEREFRIPVHGLHQARNLAAAACALTTLVGAAGLLPDDAFQLDRDELDLTAGRGDRSMLAAGGVVVDDTYNANPESVRAALDELTAIDVAAGARRVAVLGRMAELGDSSRSLHAAIGAHAAAHVGIDSLVVVGEGDELDALADGWLRARGAAALRFADTEAAAAARDSWSGPADVLLVKASNSAGLTSLATELVAAHGGLELDGASDEGGEGDQ